MLNKTLTASLIFLSILFLGVFFLWRFPVVADAFNPSELKNSQILYLKLGGSELETKVSLGQKPGQKDFSLQLSPLFANQKSISLSGFENNIRLEKQLFLNQKDYLVFSGNVGVHSQNLAVVELSKESLKVIRFNKNSSLEPSLVSDLPRFEVFVEGGRLDIASYYRDYEKDPLVDYRKHLYKLVENKFDFNIETLGQQG